MPNGISRETYRQMSADDKLNVLFDFHKDTHQCACDTQKKLIELEKKVDRKRKLDTGVAAVAGAVSGALAYLGEKITK